MIHETDMMQDIETVLVTEEEIHSRIREVGKQLGDLYRGKNPIVIGVLKGVVPFYAEMTQAMQIPMQEDFLSVSSYGGGMQSSGKLTFRKDIDQDIRGRHVLILEDILDTGVTLKALLEILRERGPASLKICTLLDKPSGRKVELDPDYTCFVIPDGFVVGYGLDYKEYYRNLPCVGILKKRVYQDD